MTVRITERTLAGIGRIYEIPLESNLTLIVALLDRGGCELSLRRPGAERACASAGLDRDETLALVAVLTGAKFSIRRDGE